MQRSQLVVSGVVSLLAATSHAQNFLHFAASGTFTGPSIHSMSANGAVVGLWRNGSSELWLPDNSFEVIPAEVTSVPACAVSDDGRYVALTNGVANAARGARYDRITQTLAIVQSSTSAPFNGISPSGNSIVGGTVILSNPGGRRPAIAFGGSSSVFVPDPSGLAGDFYDMSADENIAVGYRINGVAIRWQAGGAVQALPGAAAYAWAISNDGTRIVGQANGQSGFWEADGNGTQVFTSIDTSMIGVPTGARGMSPDGQFIVGGFQFGQTTLQVDAAYIWSLATGTQRISELLSTAGFDVQGYRFTEARSVSADGQTIAGHALDPDNVRVAFYARIPTPASSGLFALACAVAMHRRRRVTTQITARP